MGTVLRAWRRAGGDLRTPLGQPRALQLAREIGAGRYVEGSVVGVGSRLTLSASMVMTVGGTARRVGPFSGPADSLESLVGRLAAELLAVSGGVLRQHVRNRLTDSPAAMSAYLAGLSAYRRHQLTVAAVAFERAIDLDSLFTRAVFMRYQAGGWLGQPGPWGEQAWRDRNRLSRQDGILLAADLGDRYPEPRRPRAHLADLRRLVSQLPESPEAHYLLGDYLYHAGVAADLSDGFAEARAALERSVALDSQATSLRHLVEIGLAIADTALLRRAWFAFDRSTDRGVNTPFGLVVAERIGDAALSEALERRGRLVSPLTLRVAAWAGLPAEAVLRLYDRVAPPPAGGPWGNREYLASVALVLAGRPLAAAALRARAPDPEVMDYATVMGALFADGDSAAAAGAVERLASAEVAGDAMLRGRAGCARAHWRHRYGVVPPADVASLRRQGEQLCAAMLDLLRAEREGAADLEARLAAADSATRWELANTWGVEGYENLILARLWEARGDRPRALAAVRLRLYGARIVWSGASSARVEARLAALAGDTTAAIRSYWRYLDFRRDAEPTLVPQRDSVQAELARLIRH